MQDKDFSKKRILYVEGSDDCHSIISIMLNQGINDGLFDKIKKKEENDENKEDFIKQCKGVHDLLKKMPLEITRFYGRLGFVLDSDDDAYKQWQKVKKIFEDKVVNNLPEYPIEKGLIINGIKENTKIGVWLMPDNKNPGILETFLKEMIEDEEPWPYAIEATKEAKRRNALYKSETKAQVRTWLAWQEEPGIPLGTAIRKRYFKKKSTNAEVFIKWFKDLFIKDFQS